MQEYSWLIPIVVLVIMASAAVFLSFKSEFNKKAGPDDKTPKELELIERIFMGKYLGGFNGAGEIAPLVFCAVTEDYLVFRMGTHGKELGRISRNSIYQIIVDDRTSINRHLVGETSMDIEKVIHSAAGRGKGYCLVIDWDDADGMRRKTVFIFQDKQCELSANQAKENLENWVKTPALNMPRQHAFNL